MNIKLLITDLDDTIISDYKPVSPRAINAITKVKEKGIKAAIATGRMHSSAFPYAMSLNIVEPMITFNGALIKHVKSDEVIMHSPVDYNYAVEVLQFAKDMDRYIQYYSKDDYFVYEHCENSDLYGSRTGSRAIAVNMDLIKKLDFDPTKLLMVGKDEHDAEIIYNKAVEMFEGRLNITRSSEIYVEFNNSKASKGNACIALAEYYGFEISNVMAIGNGGNDVDMLEKCGFGVAVGNAVEEAKAAANHISPPQEEDGAIVAIEQFLLKR